MREYTPNFWTIVEFDSPQYGCIQKVFGTWSGGYLDGESWKLSSGNLALTVEDDCYVIPQESGSVYRLHKTANGIHWSWQFLIAQWEEAAVHAGAKFRIVPIDEILPK